MSRSPVAWISATLAGVTVVTLTSCACRTVEVDGTGALALGSAPTVPPNYVDLSPRIQRRDPEVDDYAVFDLRWTDVDEFAADAKIVVEIRGEAERYVPTDGREDLSLEEEEANSRVPVEILFDASGESRWIERRLWDLPIRSTGVFDGAPLEPARQRRLLENAGLVLLTVQPVLRNMVPWAIDWVLEQPLSLLLSMNSAQRAALTDREVVKLMTSMVEFDYANLEDLGFGRTRIPIRVGVDDIDFAVGQLTLFRAARGAGASFGVESMSLVIDEERRVDLRLRAVGSYWPRPDGVHVEGDASEGGWPLSLDGGVLGPDDGGEVALTPLPSGRVLELFDGRIAVVERPGPDGVQELVELGEGGERTFRSDPNGVFDQLYGVRRANGDLLFALHWLDMRRLEDHLLVYVLGDRGIELLADSVMKPEWLDAAPLEWAVFWRLIDRWAPLSPTGDSFVRSVEEVRELVRRDPDGLVVVTRVEDPDARIGFDPDGSRFWIEDDDSARAVRIADGQVVFEQGDAQARLLDSGWREIVEDSGRVSLIDGDGALRTPEGTVLTSPHAFDRGARFLWARRGDRFVEYSLESGEIVELPDNWPAESVVAFDGYAVFSAGEGEDREVVIRRAGAYRDVVAFEATGLRVLGIEPSEEYDDFHVFTAIDRYYEFDEDRRVASSLFLERVRGGTIESSWSLGPTFEPLARNSQNRLDSVRFVDLGQGRVLLQIASDVMVFWLDRENPLWMRLPYRVGSLSRVRVLEEPSWILYESDGKTHAYSLDRLESLADLKRSTPNAPDLREAFPGFDLDAMWHVLAAGTRDPIR